MGFNRFTKNVLNISGLPDRVQNQAATLKALFDQAGVDIKEALNALMAQLEASTAADSIGADVNSVATKTIQAILTAYEEAIADRYTKLESDTLLSENTNSLVQDVDINLTTGVITVTKKDGTVETFDTAIEKVPARFEIVETNGKYALKITNVDGTSTQTDITNLMNLYTFNNSDTINFAVTGEGNEKTIVANIKANSIGLDKLSLTVVSTLEGYMNSAKDSANAAKISENNAKSAANTATKAAETASAGAEAGRVAVQKATEAESYAHGGTGTRPGEDADNAKYYSQIAKEVAGGDFVTPTEMEAYAQPLGTTPTYDTTELSGQEIEVDASLNMESILHLSGNSEQDSRSGYNLYDYKDVIVSSSEGLTNVINADGTITTTGTPTKNYVTLVQAKLITDILEDGETYTVGQTVASNNSAYVQIDATKKDGSGTIYINPSITSKTKTFTVDKSTYSKYIIKIQSGAMSSITSPVNYTAGYMLLKGSYTDDTLPEFEAYGVQPSPDYPSEIRSVKGKSDNLVKLFANSKTIYIGSTTVEMLDYNTVRINGAITSNAWIELLYDFKNGTDAQTDAKIPLDNTLYTASCFVESGSFNNSGGYICFSATDGSTEAQHSLKFGTSQTFEGLNGIGRIYLGLNSGVTYNNLVVKVQLVKGSEAVPYQPYGYVPVEVKVEGKNLFKLPETKSLNGISYTKNANGTFNMIGTATADATFYADSIDNKFQSNIKYVCSSFGNIGAVAWRIDGYNDNKYVKTIWASNYTNNYFNTDMAGINKIICAIAVSSGTTININNVGLQIEEGSTATTYQPYGDKTISLPLGDIELRSTPDRTRDTFERVDGVWNIVGKLPKYVFTGNETCYREDTTTGKNRFRIAINLNTVSATASEAKSGLSNIGNFTSRTDNWMEKEGFAYDSVSGRLAVYFEETNAMTVDDFLQWLVSKNAYVIPLLATPTYTPITDQALISALDELEQLILHKGYNRITATAVNGVKAELDLFIPSTASVTEVVETESSQELIIPVISGEGNVKVKIPSANKMTLNLKTGEVRVGDKSLTSKSQNVTVETSDWVSDTTYAEYTYKAIKTVAGVTDSNNIIVGLTETATSEQEDMAAECGIACKGKGNDRIDLYVRELPSIALPVSVTILG